VPLQLIPIDDGFTLTATVKTPGWPDVEIVYRPALAARVRDYVLSLSKAQSGSDELKTISALLMDQVRSWDVLTTEGKPAPVVGATIRRIPDPIVRRIVDVVTGYATGGGEAEADEKNSATG
jgi:hypothetical protein